MYPCSTHKPGMQTSGMYIMKTICDLVHRACTENARCGTSQDEDGPEMTVKEHCDPEDRWPGPAICGYARSPSAMSFLRYVSDGISRMSSAFAAPPVLSAVCLHAACRLVPAYLLRMEQARQHALL